MLMDSVRNTGRISSGHASYSPAGTHSDRLLYADGIRAYAAVSVVVIHVAADLVEWFPSLSRSWWWIANIIDTVAGPAVPLFYMLSGMLLLDPAKKEPIRIFLMKRARRVLLPWLAWGIIYLCWRAFFHGEVMSWRVGIRAFVEGTIYSGFGFFYGLFGLYLATPILRVYIRNASRRDLNYFLGLWFLLVPLAGWITSFLGLEVGVKATMGAQFAGYFVAGHALRGITLNRKQLMFTLPVIAGLAAITSVGTYFLTVQRGRLDTEFYNYLSPNVVLFAVLVFLILKSLPYSQAFAKHRLLHSAVIATAASSLGIYFLNQLVPEPLKAGRIGILLSGMTLHPLIGIPLTTIVAVTFCVIVTHALRRLPLVRDVLVP